jgi:hypothetical protein
MEDALLLLHPATGVLAILAGVWVFVDAFNAKEDSQPRIRNVSILCAALMWVTYLLAGYWYVVYYGPDKAIIKAGPWAFGHSFFMEVKEHVFLMLILLATYLPIAASRDLTRSKAARMVTMWVAGLIVPLSLAMEGHGAIISAAVRMGLLKKVGG